MADNISFREQTMPVQSVVDLLATEIISIKHHIESLNETVANQTRQPILTNENSRNQPGESVDNHNCKRTSFSNI